MILSVVLAILVVLCMIVWLVGIALLEIRALLFLAGCALILVVVWRALARKK